MLNLIDPQMIVWKAQQHAREERKAHLLQQGRLLVEAYEAGELRAMLEKLKAEQRLQAQREIEPLR